MQLIGNGRLIMTIKDWNPDIRAELKDMTAAVEAEAVSRWQAVKLGQCRYVHRGPFQFWR